PSSVPPSKARRVFLVFKCRDGSLTRPPSASSGSYFRKASRESEGLFVLTNHQTPSSPGLDCPDEASGPTQSCFPFAFFLVHISVFFSYTHEQAQIRSPPVLKVSR